MNLKFFILTSLLASCTPAFSPAKVVYKKSRFLSTNPITQIQHQHVDALPLRPTKHIISFEPTQESFLVKTFAQPQTNTCAQTSSCAPVKKLTSIFSQGVSTTVLLQFPDSQKNVYVEIFFTITPDRSREHTETSTLVSTYSADPKNQDLPKHIQNLLKSASSPDAFLTRNKGKATGLLGLAGLAGVAAVAEIPSQLRKKSSSLHTPSACEKTLGQLVFASMVTKFSFKSHEAFYKNMVQTKGNVLPKAIAQHYDATWPALDAAFTIPDITKLIILEAPVKGALDALAKSGNLAKTSLGKAIIMPLGALDAAEFRRNAATLRSNKWNVYIVNDTTTPYTQDNLPPALLACMTPKVEPVVFFASQPARNASQELSYYLHVGGNHWLHTSIPAIEEASSFDSALTSIKALLTRKLTQEPLKLFSGYLHSNLDIEHTHERAFATKLTDLQSLTPDAIDNEPTLAGEDSFTRTIGENGKATFTPKNRTPRTETTAASDDRPNPLESNDTIIVSCFESSRNDISAMLTEITSEKYNPLQQPCRDDVVEDNAGDWKVPLIGHNAQKDTAISDSVLLQKRLLILPFSKIDRTLIAPHRDKLIQNEWRLVVIVDSLTTIQALNQFVDRTLCSLKLPFITFYKDLYSPRITCYYSDEHGTKQTTIFTEKTDDILVLYTDAISSWIHNLPVEKTPDKQQRADGSWPFSEELLIAHNAALEKQAITQGTNKRDAGLAPTCPPLRRFADFVASKPTAILTAFDQAKKKTGDPLSRAIPLEGIITAVTKKLAPTYPNATIIKEASNTAYNSDSKLIMHIAKDIDEAMAALNQIGHPGNADHDPKKLKFFFVTASALTEDFINSCRFAYNEDKRLAECGPINIYNWHLVVINDTDLSTADHAIRTELKELLTDVWRYFVVSATHNTVDGLYRTMQFPSDLQADIPSGKSSVDDLANFMIEQIRANTYPTKDQLLERFYPKTSASSSAGAGAAAGTSTTTQPHKAQSADTLDPIRESYSSSDYSISSDDSNGEEESKSAPRLARRRSKTTPFAQTKEYPLNDDAALQIVENIQAQLLRTINSLEGKPENLVIANGLCSTSGFLTALTAATTETMNNNEGGKECRLLFAWASDVASNADLLLEKATALNKNHWQLIVLNDTDDRDYIKNQLLGNILNPATHESYVERHIIIYNPLQNASNKTTSVSVFARMVAESRNIVTRITSFESEMQLVDAIKQIICAQIRSNFTSL